jgi:hypothetical protein
MTIQMLIAFNLPFSDFHGMDNKWLTTLVYIYFEFMLQSFLLNEYFSISLASYLFKICNLRD